MWFGPSPSCEKELPRRSRVFTESSSVAYDKDGNSLAENAVGRVRALACTLMHHVHGRLGIQLETSSAIWSWALRHAAWLISRFSVIRAATPYELAFGRTYAGELCVWGTNFWLYDSNHKSDCQMEKDVISGKS